MTGGASTGDVDGDTIDSDCDGLTDEEPGCGGGAGSVPDGLWVVGAPLLLAKDPSGDLILSWGESCSASDDDYRIFEGGDLAAGDFANHVPLDCSMTGITSWPITPSAGDRYFLVAPGNATTDRSRGYDSAGEERVGAGSCENAHARLVRSLSDDLPTSPRDVS